MGPRQRRWQPWRRQPRQYQALQFIETLGSKPKLVGSVAANVITETVQFKSCHHFAALGSKSKLVDSVTASIITETVQKYNGSDKTKYRGQSQCQSQCQ